MYKCKNNKNKTYTGKEPSPKGLGYCPDNIKVNTVKKGKDGNEWIVIKRGNIKKWIRYYNVNEDFDLLLKKSKINLREYYNIIDKLEDFDIDYIGDIERKILSTKKENKMTINFEETNIIIITDKDYKYPKKTNKYQKIEKILSGKWIAYTQSWITNQPNILTLVHKKYEKYKNYNIMIKENNKYYIETDNNAILIQDVNEFNNNNYEKKKKDLYKIKKGCISRVKENGLFSYRIGYKKSKAVLIQIYLFYL